MKAQIYILPIWLLFALFLSSCVQRERTFVQEVNKMLEWPQNGFYSDEDMQSVFEHIRNNPQSLKYEFIDEPQRMRIATSDDGRIRAYNLERSGFEGNPSLGFDCKTMIQYRYGEEVFCKVIDSLDGYITSISQIDSNKYYLLETFQGCIAQGIFETYTLYVYKVEDKLIHRAKECFANRHNISDELEFSWDDNGGEYVVDDNIYDVVFVYNKFNKELYVLKDMPQMGESFKYRQYCWNGKRFEVKNYDKPKEYRNDKFFIRIEQHSEDSWTYKCWNGGEKHGKPDLIIRHGTKQYWLEDYSLINFDEWFTYDESSPLGEKYIFCNNGFRYEYYDGWKRGRQLEELNVYNPKENLIYSGDLTPVF